MTYIKTDIPQPGIVELLFYKPSTGNALSNLAHTLLHGPSGLTPGERELLAAYVSHLNQCSFCHHSHAAAANAHLNDKGKTIAGILQNLQQADITAKMKALLALAAKVQQSGKMVQQADVDAARAAGATDEDVHDTVLIAAAFCMFNRYVDGLGTQTATDEEYGPMGLRMARQGYQYPSSLFRKIILFWIKRKNKVNVT